MSATPSPAVPPVLETRGLSKSFGGVQAVAGVDLVMPKGEIRALIASPRRVPADAVQPALFEELRD